MKFWLLRLLLLMPLSTTLFADENPMVKFETSLGSFEVELFADKAPKTVENFIRYVNGAFYDGLIFHRVIKGFMVQTGGFNVDADERKTSAPIENESSNLLENKKWTVAMARGDDPDSAASQFFINTSNNKNLNAEGKNNNGYTVFGKVIKGFKIIKAIEKTEVSPDMYLGRHRPIDNIIILRARVVKTQTLH